MTTRTRTIRCVTVLSASLMLLPIAAEAHHCKGPHKNDPECDSGGGGGGPSTTVPLMTTFDCPAVSGEQASCPDPANPNRLQADLAGAPYVNDEENMLNRIGSTGRFALSTGAKRKKPKPRSVYWDVTHVNGGVPLPNGNLVFTTTADLDVLGIEHRTVIHVGTEFVEQGGNFQAMQPGDTVNADLWADIGMDTGQGGDQVLLRFSPYGSGQCFGRYTSAVGVTRTDNGTGQRQWTISVPFGAVACVFNFDQDLGDYVFGPFQLQMTEL